MQAPQPCGPTGSAPVSSGAVAVYSVDSAPRATGCAISGATRPSTLAMSFELSIFARPCAPVAQPCLLPVHSSVLYRHA